MAKIIGVGGKILGEEATPAAFLDATVGSHTIFRAVFRELANPRAGTASTKRRDEVRGGGKKPWKQKGTGRARQGSTRSPQWRHGGVVFGPKPRSYVTSLNRKERRAAFIAALADRFRVGAIELLDPQGVAVAKSRDFSTLIFGGRHAGDAAQKTLVVFAGAERGGIGRDLVLGGRNLRAATVTSTDALDIAQLLNHKRIIVTVQAHAELAALGAKNG